MKSKRRSFTAEFKAQVAIETHGRASLQKNVAFPQNTLDENKVDLVMLYSRFFVNCLDYMFGI